MGWEINSHLISPNESEKKIVFQVFNDKGGRFSTPEISVPAGKFVEIVGTFDGQNVRLYTDGVLRSEVPFSGKYNPLGPDLPLKFGGGSYCSCDSVSAIFDEIRLYNIALSDAEIKKISTNNKLSDYKWIDRGLEI